MSFCSASARFFDSSMVRAWCSLTLSVFFICRVIKAVMTTANRRSTTNTTMTAAEGENCSFQRVTTSRVWPNSSSCVTTSSELPVGICSGGVRGAKLDTIRQGSNE